MSGWRLNTDFARWLSRRYAENNMTTQIRIGRPSSGSAIVDDDDRLLARPVPARLIYEGKARLYQLSGPQDSSTTEESTTFSSSYVSTPLKDEDGKDVVTQVNDLIEILDTEDDLVVGCVMRVLDVDAGGLLPVARRHMVSTAQRFRGWTWVTEPASTRS